MFVTVARAALLWAALCGAAVAAPTTRTYDGNCGAPVTSPEDAMSKADFVIEGTVIAAIYPNEPHPPLAVAVEKVKVIRQQGSAVVDDITLSLTIGPCFASGMGPFTFGEPGSVHGKRMRFYGNEHRFNDGRRFFYMQPVEDPLPLVGKDDGLPKIKRYGKGLRHPVRDGWHRARSTGGHFAVDLPGPYTDETIRKDGDVQFVLRAADRRGGRFAVAFVRSAVATSLEELFDAEMQKTDAFRSEFQGMPAVFVRELRGASVLNSLLVRVPGGTFRLSVTTTLRDEVRSRPARERFFASLALGK